MSARFVVIAVALCLAIPAESFAKGSPVTVKVCDSVCKHRAACR